MKDVLSTRMPPSFMKIRRETKEKRHTGNSSFTHKADICLGLVSDTVFLAVLGHGHLGFNGNIVKSP